MKIFIILLLSSMPLFADDTLIPLKSGEAHHDSYTLSYLKNPGAYYFEDLVLTLRAGGAKIVSFGPITDTNFDLRDANGNSIQVYTPSLPRDMTSVADGDVVVIHLMAEVPPAQDSPQPWTLRFRTGAESFPGNEPWDLVITGIELQKKTAFTVETLIEAALGGLIIGLLTRYVFWRKTSSGRRGLIKPEDEKT